MYKLASNCVFVSGSKKSVILDLQRQKIYWYLNEFISQLFQEMNSKFSTKEVLNAFEDLQRNDVLIDIDSDEISFFPALSLEYDYPAIINNAIIEIGNTRNDLLPIIFNQLNDLLCKHIELRFIEDYDIEQIKEILLLLSETTIQTVDIQIVFKTSLAIADLIKIKKIYVYIGF